MTLVETRFLLLVVSVAAFTDLKGGKIPNWLTFPAMVMGIYWQRHAGPELADHVAGLLLGLSFLWPWYKLGGMGGGDVKLMGAVGAIGGVNLVVRSAFWSALIGGVWGGLKLVKKRWFEQTSLPWKHVLSHTIPYGVAIALGTFWAIGTGGGMEN